MNDVLRKRRKSDHVGWQAFAQQLKRINLPMELVGNAERRRYIRQAATTTPVAVTPRNRPLPRWTPYSRWQVEQSKSPQKKNVSVGCRHWMVGSPFKRFVRNDDSTVNHGIGSGHISLGSPRSAVQDRRLLPTDRSACLRAVHDC